MNRRRIVVNSALGLALVGVGAVAFVSLSNASSGSEPTGRTVAVTRGTLTATVTASGNLETATTIDVQLAGSGGTVTKIYVKEGQRVTKGQQLLRIDDTSAKQGLRTAEASLASAKAQLATTTQGRSVADRQVDDAGIKSAQTALRNARAARSAAADSYALDQRQQAKLVDAAKDDLAEARAKKKADEAALTAAQRRLDADRAAGDAAAVTTDQTTVNNLTSAIATDVTAIRSAESAVTQARQTRDRTLLQDRQSITTQSGQVGAAEDALASQRASVAANQQPARAGAVESAQSQIDSAEVTVDQAKQTLADTVLRAPQAGVVASIAAVRGQSSSSTSTTSGSDSTATGSTGSSTSTSSGSGLVTLVGVADKQIKASVAEADATLVKVGQPASAVFAATGQTVTGRVTAIDTESTVTNNVVEYDVTIGLGAVSSGLRLGQTVSVTITTASKTGVLIVPTSTLTVADNTTTVIRRSNGTDAPVSVQTGLVGATGTEITSGLAEGDQVVVPTGGSGSLTIPGANNGASSSATPR